MCVAVLAKVAPSAVKLTGVTAGIAKNILSKCSNCSSGGSDSGSHSQSNVPQESLVPSLAVIISVRCNFVRWM